MHFRSTVRSPAQSPLAEGSVAPDPPVVTVISGRFLAVIAGFRGTVPYGLSLEIGDTVQILEKCDGEWAAGLRWCWQALPPRS